ncbi:MAG: HD domain-containing protein [Alphaproteobacteria bacterium]|nr:HD domain-containing protein [Alphaproteobacteria bacterium]
MENFERPNLTNMELVIISSLLQKTKRGDDYRRLSLSTADGSATYPGVMWANDLRKFQEERYFRTGNVIKLTNYDPPSTYSDYVIHDFVLIKEGKIGLSLSEITETYDKVLQYVKNIKDAKLRDFLASLLKDYGEAFKIAPAAKTMHHNYLGGLLEHTYECLEIAKDFLDKNPKIDRDTVYSACILHDFGKIWEYTIDTDTGAITYNNSFTYKWVSHSQWGYTTCMSAGFETVAKMIATHHGRIDWGAVIDLDAEGLEPIHYLLHHIDDLSAKFGKTTVMDL